MNIFHLAQRLIYLLPFIVMATGCQTKTTFDQQEATKEILKLHQAQRKYHFEKDSISFVNQLSENMVSVNRGKITHPTREENLKRNHHYFSSVDFEKWDDLQSPIIRFSDDGSLAYTVVDKLVELTYEDEQGKKAVGKTHFAWIAIYRKTADGWKIEAVASTNEPEATE